MAKAPIDTRTPVDDNDYKIPFRFTGKLDKLTFKLGPTQLTSEDHQVIQRRRIVLTDRRGAEFCANLRPSRARGRSVYTPAPRNIEHPLKKIRL